jgi:hypothetical protein
VIPTAANKVADAGSVSAGTYYPFFFDGTNYSPAGTGVTVTIWQHLSFLIRQRGFKKIHCCLRVSFGCLVAN